MSLALGGTISELQSRMTLSEIAVWHLYLKKYGSLNPVRKYDRMGAIVASVVSHAFKGKLKPSDVMLYDAGEDVEEASAADMMAAFSSTGRVRSPQDRKWKVNRNGKRR